MLNIVVLQARLTEDPELRATPKGTSVCNIRLASNQRFKDSEGNPQERVCFVDADAFGKTAELIAKHFAKGSEIIVQGELIYDSWKDKEDNPRSKHSIRVDTFQFVGSKPKSADEDAEPAGVASGRKS